MLYAVTSCYVTPLLDSTALATMLKELGVKAAELSNLIAIEVFQCPC